MIAAAAAGAPILSRRSLAYEGFDPAQERLREALCALGNGCFASRGAAPEAVADGVHYPGTYAAGCYNRLTSVVAGREVADESIVNLPNWLPLTFRIEDGEWFDLSTVELIAYRQELDLLRAVLSRELRFRDGVGRETAMSERRFLSMANPHLAALETTLVPINWSGRITFRSALDGRVVNGGVERYRGLANRHLVPLDTQVIDSETLLVQAETSQSHIRIAEAARTRLIRDGEAIEPLRGVIEEPAWIGLELEAKAAQGEAITVEKTAALYTSREPAISEPGADARNELARALDFEELLSEHVLRWDELWDICSLEVEGQELASAVSHLHIFHLLGNISGHTAELDAGVPARGLSGEAYRGHIFWDALFIFPFFNVRLPGLTRTLIRYRHRRLKQARWAAADAGYEGAMFPWQSGSNGHELTPTVHFNPRSGHWVPDNSRLQRHINAAIAHDIWRYQQATNDVTQLAFYGAEVFIEIARFWASIASYEKDGDRYVIRGVVGPDEYHDSYPDSERAGIDNSAYTNVMAAWVLWRAPAVIHALPEQRRRELWATLGLRDEELERWDEISRRLFVPFHDDGIISQFEGYETLEELDWDGYRRRYGNIQRLDRILEAEGDTPNRYKASKQADVLMLFYLLSADELGELFERLGYPLEPDTIPKNVEYYLARTSHGSTLSQVVHAWVLVRADRERSWELFSEALESDISDIQGGTTPEGVHLGAMAGTVDLLQRAYTGLEMRDEVLWLDPRLPAELRELRLKVCYRRHWGIEIVISKERIRISAPPADVYPINVAVRGEVIQLDAGATVERSLSPQP